jgi:hypothetical protein
MQGILIVVAKHKPLAAISVGNQAKNMLDAKSYEERMIAVVTRLIYLQG